MELNTYQSRAMETCTKSSDNFAYMFINLVAELGEFAGKVSKPIRKEQAMIDFNQLITERGANEMSEEQLNDLKAEAGDILWQLSGLCKAMGWTLEEVAEQNLAKLRDRAQRGKIIGDGDNR